jgi:hypothetical protein
MAIRLGTSNHVELVHRPGEAALAVRVLKLLGVNMNDTPFTFAGTTFYGEAEGVLYVSEVTKEQWAFEQWLQNSVAKDNAEAARQFLSGHRDYPQRYAHFGIGLETLDDWEAVVARVQKAAASDPELKGRIGFPLVARPGDEGSAYKATGMEAAKTVYQAFFHTNIFSGGLLTVGQSIDVQHYREHDPNWKPEKSKEAALV